MVEKWLDCHSESVMSSSFPRFKLSKHDAFTTQCPFLSLLYSRYTVFISLNSLNSALVKVFTIAFRKPIHSLAALSTTQ